MSLLATETLTQIFDLLDKRSDLVHVIQTCKVFYGIGIAQLYRHIRYDSYREFKAHDAFCLTRRDVMHHIPRSLGLNGVIYPDQTAGDDLADEGRRARFQVDMWVRVLSFTSLHTLDLRNCGLPDAQSFSYLLQGCQSLRRLVIDQCTFYEVPLNSNEGYGIFPWLPIIDLSLLGRTTVHKSTLPGRDDPYSFLHLLTVTSLRTLAIDVHELVYRFLVRRAPYKHDLSLPCKLQTLRLYFGSSPFSKDRQEELATFLNEKCHFVRELEVFGFFCSVPESLRLFPGALGNLTSYKGPPGFLTPFMDTGSSLKRLEIRNFAMCVSEASSLLGKVGARWPNLESLDITIKEWDMEILYAISHMFRDFREVKIKYRSGYLDDSSILSMASMFFSEMKNLTTLHIYNSMWFSDGDNTRLRLKKSEVCGLMAGWIKTCPNLTEVKWDKDKQFCRKSTKEHRWCSRMDLQPVPSVTPSRRKRRREYYW
ncbi:hypothetical protein DFS33DRAFT_1387201 [Desarmillaria ectypa]|nr:hypothetical protein DFS33DRAFT_1387201 [Desarmillaria ectypa]